VAGDSLLLDERLLEGCDPKRLFACVVAERDLEHLRGLAEPGDHVVFDRDGAAGPGRIAAVRTPEGLRLARVLHRGPTLLLLPGEGGDAFRTVTLPDPQDPSSALAGAHRLLIRR
jgi:hypothetical protein